jgi:hypothetical protein
LCTEQMQNKGLLVKRISDLNLSKQVGIVTQNPANLSLPGQCLFDYLASLP